MSYRNRNYKTEEKVKDYSNFEFDGNYEVKYIENKPSNKTYVKYDNKENDKPKVTLNRGANKNVNKNFLIIKCDYKYKDELKQYCNGKWDGKLWYFKDLSKDNIDYFFNDDNNDKWHIPYLVFCYPKEDNTGNKYTYSKERLTKQHIYKMYGYPLEN